MSNIFTFGNNPLSQQQHTVLPACYQGDFTSSAFLPQFNNDNINNNNYNTENNDDIEDDDNAYGDVDYVIVYNDDDADNMWEDDDEDGEEDGQGDNMCDDDDDNNGDTQPQPIALSPQLQRMEFDELLCAPQAE